MRISFADVIFDSEEHCVSRGGMPVHLSPKAFDLLEVLIRQRPRVVRKQEIVDTLWPDVVVEEANVRNLVAEIRGAIGSAGAHAIVTLPRVGYAFRSDAVEQPASECRVVVDGDEMQLEEGPTIVGRADDCDIVLRASGVSRYHLRITLSHAGALVEDLGSKNGTWLNGRKLAAAASLHDGDELCIGSSILQVKLPPSENDTTTFVGSTPGRSRTC